MPTIKDVADHANVSIATVSRVLNSSGYVSPELDQRVRKAIELLGYQPNTIARNLRRNENLTIGVLIPDSNNPFFAEVAKGIEDACFEHDYTVVLCNTAESPQKAAAYVFTLYQQRVAGLIIVSIGSNPFIEQLVNEGYPLVAVDRPLPDIKSDMVVSDNYDGASQAVRHLLDLGHRQIGFITGNRAIQPIKQRLAGALDAMKAANIESDPALIYDQGEHSPQTGAKGAEILLSSTTPPTAIFAFNDITAFGILNFAYEHRINVPRDLSVVGFDDIMLASFAVPSLTTVAQPRYNLGRTVAEMLLSRIQGNRETPIQMVLPTRLIIRQSTARLERYI
jgi:LacI family transcriptional regulator